MKITIIGAGIGGLTLANALEQKGIDYEIFESFPSFRPMGAGILLANNAMQVYKHLGLHSSIIASGEMVDSLQICKPDLTPLSISPTSSSANDLKTIGIHRGTLQKILLKGIPAEKIHLKKRLQKAERKDRFFHLFFDDNQSHTTNYLVGADGIHSIVRSLIVTDSHIRRAHQSCWRGIVDYRLGNQQYGNLSTSSLAIAFKNFDPLVSKLISATPDDSVLFNKMEDLSPINQWTGNGVTLLGDAAHATTPNMGQGACQAIEDAYILSNRLSSQQPDLAFQSYEKQRIKKAQRVVNTSWKVGKLAHIKNPIAVFFRNFMLKNTPSKVMAKQNEWLFDIGH